ncbi:hypothetical protein HMPREF9069_00937 [Atopobium sp. oral taxon 810 str. F0209]|nr:hypothetical protein HMPREF9069_00937 [Atopobium sp. oral taxon 810 str. F0209]
MQTSLLDMTPILPLATAVWQNTTMTAQPVLPTYCSTLMSKASHKIAASRDENHRWFKFRGK